MTEDRRKGKERRSPVDRRQNVRRVRDIPVATERRKGDARRSGGDNPDRYVASRNRS